MVNSLIKICRLIVLLIIANTALGQPPCRVYQPSEAIVLTNVHDKEINGLALSHIILNHCYNITVKNCKISPDTNKAIGLGRCANIRVHSCYWFNMKAGVYALQSAGILITNCQGRNMQVGVPHGGQFVQFNEVTAHIMAC